MLSEDGLLHLWKHIYALTNDVTPLKQDCGQLCGSMCCRDWAPGVGMYLYPGEQLLLADQPWLKRQWHDSRHHIFPASWGDGGWFVTCTESCPRHLRPFSCRTFPLTPHMDETKHLTVVLDEKGRTICPLVQAGRPELLSAQFRCTMREAWKKLVCLPAIRDDVLMGSRRRENARR